MKKYMIKRILFSIFSLFVVVMVVMLLVYSLIDRSVIFQTDDTWNKKSNNDRTMYEYAQYQKYSYLTYVDYTSFLKNKYVELVGEKYDKDKDFKADKKAIQKGKDFSLDENNEVVYSGSSESVQEFLDEYRAKGCKIVYLEPMTYKNGKAKPGGNGYLIAVQEKNVVFRLLDYLKGFISAENMHMVQDPELPESERYIRFEKDPYSGLFALVGNGTQHKYLLYFDDRFPFVHQNWLHLNLGVSYTTYRGQEITDVINNPTGDLSKKLQQYPIMLGTDQYDETAIDFHTLSYNTGTVSDKEKEQFPDKYTVYKYRRSGMSMIENSFVIGLIATAIAYAFGVPLGILMARRKDKLADKLGNGYIIFIMAVPSLAYIFMFAAVGTKLLGLPYKFANAEVKILAYVLPTISLSLPWTGGLMKWMRRYMIDQMNADYVKFARAEGLSEREIYKIHISRNAFIPLVHGVPGAILGNLVGAIITETVYSVPGVGRLLTEAIAKHDNGVIVAVTVFYTSLSIISQILGDLLMAKYDPRISLNADKGGGR